AQRAGKLLGLEVSPTRPLRRATLAALGRAWIAAGRKDIEAAVVDLERAAHDPAAAAIVRPLATYLSTAREDASLRPKTQLVVDAKAALAAGEKLVADNPSQMGGRLLAARALLGLGRRADALDVLRPRPGDLEASELHALRGEALLDGKHAKEAEHELARAV